MKTSENSQAIAARSGRYLIELTQRELSLCAFWDEVLDERG